MKNSDTLKIIQDRLAKFSDSKLKPEEITLSTLLREDLDLDSLSALSLMMEMEDEYKIHIEEEEIASLKTVGDAVQLIESKKNPTLDKRSE